MPRFYPDAPRVGVSVLCHKDGHTLMVKRGRAPFKGHWSLPGGLVELGEPLKAAAERELLEETGVRAALDTPVETFDSIQHDDAGKVVTHFVLAVFCGPLLSGEAKAADDAAALQWVPLSGLDELLTTPGTPDLVRRHLPK